MIDLTDLGGATFEHITKLIEKEADEVIEIYVPKETVLFNSEPADIAHDYILAAYAGQELSKISISFKYDEVEPAFHKSILFEIETSHTNLLADVILNLTYVYGINENPEWDGIDQMEIIESFIGEIDSISLACPYFVDIFKEYDSEVDEGE